VPPEEDVEVVEKFFEAIFREGKEEGPFHPISVTAVQYECLRRGYYNALVPEELISLDGKVRTWIGRKLHETPIYPVHELRLVWAGVHGRIDEYDPASLKIVEKKTVRSIPREPRPHHVEQLKFYRVLMERNGFPVENASILYIDVSSARVRAYRVDVLDEPLEAIEDRMVARGQLLRDHLLSHQLPPRRMSWLCDYCAYVGWCFSDYNPPVPPDVLQMLNEEKLDIELVRAWLVAPRAFLQEFNCLGDQVAGTVLIGDREFRVKVDNDVVACSCGRERCEHALFFIVKAWLENRIPSGKYERLKKLFGAELPF